MQNPLWDALLRPVSNVRSCCLAPDVRCCGYMVRANFAIAPLTSCSTTCSRRSVSAVHPSQDARSDAVAYRLRYLYDAAVSASTSNAQPSVPSADTSTSLLSVLAEGSPAFPTYRRRAPRQTHRH
eukprot:3248131-Amphidinium_carterae.2